MSKTCLLVNPARREYIDPDRLGEGTQFHNVLSGPHCLLALKRLIADPPLGASAIDARWTGDTVVLASGWGGEDNLHDRAQAEFNDISQVALAALCDDDKGLHELLDKASESDILFVNLCDALTTHLPEMLHDRRFTAVLGADWRKRYNEIRCSKPWLLDSN